ncbi:hypothetical protein Nepgr_012433 [Nepenthes gracilis]|uniref:Uncharacterized protein n=1 Tax=Nepenthes gracilis TaxID=150966 RepID=A0AAD3SHB1_NEPGR|nr:hypothetical protein Nepgr_012433 [Nepenthes gracilis]
MELEPLSDAFVSSAPVADSDPSRKPSRNMQSNPQASWAAVVQNSGRGQVPLEAARCTSCKKTGHSAAQCKPKKLSKPIEGAKSASLIKSDPMSKNVNSGAIPSAVIVSRVCLPDPATGPREASTILMDHKIPDGFDNKAMTQDAAPHDIDTPCSTLLQDVNQPKLGDQEDFASDSPAANKIPNVAHISAAANSHSFLAAEPQSYPHDGLDPANPRGSLDSVRIVATHSGGVFSSDSVAGYDDHGQHLPDKASRRIIIKGRTTPAAKKPTNPRHSNQNSILQEGFATSAPANTFFCTTVSKQHNATQAFTRPLSKKPANGILNAKEDDITARDNWRSNPTT